VDPGCTRARPQAGREKMWRHDRHLLQQKIKIKLTFFAHEKYSSALFFFLLQYYYNNTFIRKIYSLSPEFYFVATKGGKEINALVKLWTAFWRAKAGLRFLCRAESFPSVPLQVSSPAMYFWCERSVFFCLLLADSQSGCQFVTFQWQLCASSSIEVFPSKIFWFTISTEATQVFWRLKKLCQNYWKCNENKYKKLSFICQ
jgi:hypothetical protein